MGPVDRISLTYGGRTFSIDVDYTARLARLLAEPEVAPRIAFEGRTLNAAIGSPAQRLYLDGHYAQAVIEAGKTLINLVKTKSGRPDLDGVALMQTVFSVNDPILAFNDRSDQSDKTNNRA